jgi:hypothetical protein
MPRQPRLTSLVPAPQGQDARGPPPHPQARRPRRRRQHRPPYRGHSLHYHDNNKGRLTASGARTPSGPPAPSTPLLPRRLGPARDRCPRPSRHLSTQLVLPSRISWWRVRGGAPAPAPPPPAAGGGWAAAAAAPAPPRSPGPATDPATPAPWACRSGPPAAGRCATADQWPAAARRGPPAASQGPGRGRDQAAHLIEKMDGPWRPGPAERFRFARAARTRTRGAGWTGPTASRGPGSTARADRRIQVPQPASAGMQAGSLPDHHRPPLLLLSSRSLSLLGWLPPFLCPSSRLSEAPPLRPSLLPPSSLLPSIGVPPASLPPP